MNRIKYIDWLKGIGILSIMYAHCTSYFPELSTTTSLATSYHVPIFFIAAGCLEYYISLRNIEYNFKNKLFKLLKTLIVPYLIFSIFNSVLKIGVLFITHGLTNDVIKEEIIAFLFTGNGAVWFLLCLFGIKLLYTWLFEESINEKSTLILFGVFGFLCIILPYFLPTIPNTSPLVIIERIIGGFGYYVIGFFLSKLLKKDKYKNSTIVITGSCILLYALVVYIVCLNQSHFSFFGNTYVNAFKSFSCSIGISVGLALLFSAADKMDLNNVISRIVTYYGKNSLICMLLHQTILLCFTFKFSNYFSNMGKAGIVGGLVLFVIVTLLEIPCIIIVNKYFYFLLGQSKKGK